MALECQCHGVSAVALSRFGRARGSEKYKVNELTVTPGRLRRTRPPTAAATAAASESVLTRRPHWHTVALLPVTEYAPRLLPA